MTIHQDMKEQTYSVAFTKSQWLTIMLAIWDSVDTDEKRFTDDKKVFWSLADEKVALRDAIREIVDSNN